MSRGFILFVALVYTGLGVGFLLLPASMTSGIDLAPTTATALTDVRATYGGFELGVAGLLVAFVAMRSWIPGLLTVLFTVAGFAVGRGFGLIMDGIDGALHPALLFFELSVIAAAVLLLRRERQLTVASSAA